MTTSPTNQASKVELFKEMAEISGAQLHQLASEVDLKELIRQLANGAPISWLGKASASSKNPDRQDFTRTQVTISRESFPEPSQRTVAVAVAKCAIAETGSVVFLEDSRAEMLHSLLCEDLLVLTHSSQILASLSDTSEIIAEAAGNHQQVTFLTGPSRTGDIELHHVNGIQGPYEVHIAICDFPWLVWRNQ